MLMAVGQSTVNTLDTGGDSDPAVAEGVLDTINQEIQEIGWHCNTEHNVSLALDSNNNIQLASNVLRVDSDNASASQDVSRRGTFLYDKENKTFVFTAAVRVTQIKLLNFEDLPPALKTFITTVARRNFQQDVVGGQQQDVFKFEEVQRKQATALQEDAENEDLNMITSNPSLLELRGRRKLIPRS
jgi:hypothetical protein